MGNTVVKTIKKTYKDKIEAGVIWFKFITSLNNISLAKRELELMAFTNNRGTISSTSAKNDFCIMFDSSMGTISNITARLLKRKLLVKEKGKIKVNPSLAVDFDNDLVVRFYVNINREQEEVNNAD